MYLDGCDMSCGVGLMNGISNDNTPKDILISLGEQNDSMKSAFVQWSDIWGRNRMGNKLYHYVRRQFPKSNIQRTKTARNPNSGNKICLYTWKIPRNFKSWWREASGFKSCPPNKYDLDWCTKHNCYPECCTA